MTAALAGKALLFLGCTALGVLRGQGLRQRAACLQAFRRVLAALARELAFSLRPLDQLMAGAQEGSQGPVADFFRACRQAFTAGGRESSKHLLAPIPVPLLNWAEPAGVHTAF